MKIINGSILLSSCPVFPVGKTNGWGHNFPLSEAHTVNLFTVSLLLKDVSGTISDSS